MSTPMENSKATGKKLQNATNIYQIHSSHIFRIDWLSTQVDDQ